MSNNQVIVKVNDKQTAFFFMTAESGNEQVPKKTTVIKPKIEKSPTIVHVGQVVGTDMLLLLKRKLQALPDVSTLKKPNTLLKIDDKINEENLNIQMRELQQKIDVIYDFINALKAI